MSATVNHRRNIVRRFAGIAIGATSAIATIGAPASAMPSIPPLFDDDQIQPGFCETHDCVPDYTASIVRRQHGYTNGERVTRWTVTIGNEANSNPGALWASFENRRGGGKLLGAHVISGSTNVVAAEHTEPVAQRYISLHLRDGLAQGESTTVRITTEGWVSNAELRANHRHWIEDWASPPAGAFEHSEQDRSDNVARFTGHRGF